MKKSIPLVIGMLLLIRVALCQTWFERNVQIGQSMETAEKKGEPAQFQFTIPRKDTSSWLINMGVAIKLGSDSESFISKLIGEYHKNTLTDKEQENLSFGYNYTWSMFGTGNTSLINIADPKYVYDDVKKDHSVASNILFGPNYDGDGLHLNAETYSENLRHMVLVSPFVGVQLQDIFNAEKDSTEGFILRPIVTVGFKYAFNKPPPPPDPESAEIPVGNPIVMFSTNYTARYGTVNTSYFDEDYTYLFNVGLEYFIGYNPIKISVGCSWNYGSDPLKGLAQQQYWLISLNISK